MDTRPDLEHEELIRVFRAETVEHLTLMEQALLQIESDPGDDEALATLFRCTHTLKGNVGVLDLDAPEELAHALESLLDRVRARQIPMSSALVTLMLRAVDALRVMVPEALAGAPAMNDERRALVAAVRAAAEGGASFASAVAGLAGGGRLETATARTLRVDVTKLDRMMDLVGEIAVARGRLLMRLEALGAAGAAALEAAHDADALCHGLQELVTSARMVPVGPLFRRYARMVRDCAAQNGRRARLVLEGEDVEVDTSVVEGIADPLTHMIRNAVDHGIEPPEARAAAGKDACGTITLRAFHQAGGVVVQVCDDGAGLDRARIAARARERGLLPNDAAAVPETDIDRLIFEPGFSTAESVTTLSGRGVGMDVVRRSIEALRGRVDVESRPQAGTTLTIRLPLTLSIISGLAVGVAEETYVLPIESVVECLDLTESGDREAREGVLALRGEALPYLRLRRVFEAEGVAAAREYVVVVRHEGRRLGLAVDALRGETQAVVKPLDGLLRHLPGLTGSTLLGDGRVALILDVALLVGGVLAQAEAAA